jgi:hypothetical protein
MQRSLEFNNDPEYQPVGNANTSHIEGSHRESIDLTDINNF